MVKTAEWGDFRRTYGAKLREQARPSRPASEVVTKHYDIALYELTGELKFLGEEGNETMPDQETLQESRRRAVIMKTAIKTVADFVAAGGGRGGFPKIRGWPLHS